ncbi:hypothetical protein DPMN_023954 [Dreissena polymorpha]|uniref:Mutator-like transposase domain-containing protein n=1 Tax=Dreissena polymorpha TaxID=45954 RepID=A0A9D4RB64_DREPO|nr:hypothetical protein DPMN_023954 [Dreissena polymorpha]
MSRDTLDVIKHVVFCEAAKQLVITDNPVVKILSELRTQGLASVLFVCCCGCKNNFKLETSPRLMNMDTSTAYNDINVRAVWGSIVTGNGASHLKEVMATMDAPSFVPACIYEN